MYRFTREFAQIVAEQIRIVGAESLTPDRTDYGLAKVVCGRCQKETLSILVRQDIISGRRFPAQISSDWPLRDENDKIICPEE